MHRFRLIRVAAIALIALLTATSCSDDTVEGRLDVPPTPRPVPTIEGRALEGFAPDVDDRVAVIGVGAAETLTMRALPGVTQPVVAEIPSSANDLFGFGQSFETDDGRLWWLVRWADAQGWIEPGAAYLGESNDVTTAISGQLPSSTFATMTELVAAVGSNYGSDYVIVETRAASTDAPATTTLDFLAADDVLRGRRLVIEGSTDGTTYTIQSIAEIPLCRRGLSETGRCI